MLNPFESKSIFIWNVPSIGGGDPAKIVALLQAGGFEAVFIKAAQAGGVFYPSALAFPLWLGKPNLSRNLVDALHAAGIAVAGWGFCNGTDGDAEGRIAASQVAALDLDGWGWDVEGAFEAWTDAHDPTLGIGRAGKVLGTYKKNIVKPVPTALISWAQWHDPTPNTDRPWHNKPMASFFMNNSTYAVDYGMPMCYWAHYGADGKPVPTIASDAVKLLDSARNQWQEFTSKPLVPIGRAYTGDGGIASAESVSGFDMQAAIMQSVRGLSWWVLDQAKDMALIWQALISTHPFHSTTPPPPPPPVLTLEDRVAALEADMDAVKKNLGIP